MNVVEEFTVAAGRPEVWAFFEQVERVAACLPGVGAVREIDPDTYDVELTQSLGIMKVTFAAKLRITERDEERRLVFTASGQSVRGAAGTVHATNIVTLDDAPEGGTIVRIEADVALGGMLGAVGQKVVAKQSAKVAKAFAGNLEQELRPDAGAA